MDGEDDSQQLGQAGKLANDDLGGIGRISLRVAVPLFYDSYNRNRQTGSFILIDPGTNETVAAGMIV